MKNTDLSLSLKSFTTLFRRYHLTFFIVFVTAGLGFAVVSFTQLFADSTTDPGYTSPISAGSIDQSTLERIKALHTSDEKTPAMTTPSGRINPFSE